MTTARAHTNIALIKYWGKRDSQLILPYTSSISMTLDEFYTDTQVVFDAALTADELYLDGTKRDVTKVATVLDWCVSRPMNRALHGLRRPITSQRLPVWPARPQRLRP